MPSHNTCFFHTARTFAPATMNHKVTSTTVKTVNTHSMAGAASTSPIAKPAVVRATCGKMNDHHCSVKYVCLRTIRLLTAASAKNQKLRSQKKTPAGTPTAFHTSPTGKVVMPKKPSGMILCPVEASAINVYEVYPMQVESHQ